MQMNDFFCAGGMSMSVGATLYANRGKNVQNNLKKTIYQRLFLIFKEFL